MYTADWDQLFPCFCKGDTLMASGWGEAYCGHGTAGDTARFDKASYKAQLMPYVKNGSMFFCPSDNSNDGWGAPAKDVDHKAGSRFTTYHYRYVIGARCDAGLEPYGDNDIGKPAQIYVFHETVPRHDTTHWTHDWNWQKDSKFNCTFIDGHAKTVAAGQIISDVGDYHWINHNVNNYNGVGCWYIAADAYDIQ